MLAEAFFCLFEAPFLKKGWAPVREQAAILARYRRHRDAWEPHLAASRDMVLEGAGRCPVHGVAAILGSGLLLDLPLEELCRRFGRVVLIDLHHPEPARRMRKRHANLELRVADVRERDFWPSLISSCDLVVSLNLAGQLALGEDGAQAVSHHLAGLNTCKGVRVLISETARVEYDPQGREIASEPALPERADLKTAEKRWTWHLAPPGELAPYRGLALEIGAWIWGTA